MLKYVCVSVCFHLVLATLLFYFSPKLKRVSPTEQVLHVYTVIQSPKKEKPLPPLPSRVPEAPKQSVQTQLQNKGVSPEEATQTNSHSTSQKNNPVDDDTKLAVENVQSSIKAVPSFRIPVDLSAAAKKHFKAKPSVPKTIQNKQFNIIKPLNNLIKEQAYVAALPDDVLYYKGKCYKIDHESPMGRMGMPSASTPCPGKKSHTKQMLEQSLKRWQVLRQTTKER